MNPEKLLFAKTHEWVALEAGPADKIATIGVSKFALDALTDLVFIDLPKLGRMLQAGAAFGEIESVKAVSDLYSPVTGEVVAVNDALANKLDVLGADPYGQGWMIKVKLSSDQDLADLLDYEAYRKQCAEEQH